jgi:hypothetical protein
MPEPRSSRVFYAFTAALLLGWLFLVLPVALGRETLYFRDVFLTHFPLKAFGAAELAAGGVPALNPTWALGQPFRGNPNAVALYPGNLLYLVLPFWPAFNLHYVLHWLLAGVGMGVLARTLGMSRQASLLAAATYAGSGWMLSVMTFYNILTVVAWWPLVMASVVARSRWALALGALACGMALLGGEPVTALLGLVPLTALALRVHGLRVGLLRVATVGAAGCVVALPQLVATARVVGFSFRGTHGVLASQANYYSLDPRRLVELVLPFPFGLPGHEGAAGLAAAGALDHVPFYYSLHFGLVAALLAVFALRRQPMLTALAGAGLFLSWLGGLSGEALLAIGGGIFRSPEKLLFWVALVLPLLAAAGLDRRREACSERQARPVLAAAASLALMAAATVVSGRLPSVLLGAIVAPGARAAQLGLWVSGLGVAAVLMAAAWWALRRGRTEVLLGLQIVSLLQLAPLWMTDDVAAYEAVAWLRGRGDGGAAAVARMGYPAWQLAGSSASPPPGPRASIARFQAEQLAPAPGVLHGVHYPVAPDLDGMHHLFYNLLTVRIAEAPWGQRARWLEVLGVDTLVSPEPVSAPPLRATGTFDMLGARSWVYSLPSASPAAWWPSETIVASSPGSAFDAVAASEPGSLVAVVPEAIEHYAGARVEVLERSADRLRIEVEGEGGLLVVRRAFQPILRASIGDAELPILPSNLCLLGVLVPEGRHEVRIEADSGPEKAAGAVSMVAVVLLAVFAPLERRRSRRVASAAG